VDIAADHLALSDPPLEITLLGPFQARLRGVPISGLHERHADRLLAYLALQNGRSVVSVELARLFWPDTESLDSLHQSLKILRRALGAEAVRLDNSRGSVRLTISGARVDVACFDAALRRGDDASLLCAARLYQGMLLEGWEEVWLKKDREARRLGHLNALFGAAAAVAMEGDNKTATEYLRLYVQHNPCDERGWYELIRNLASRGERPSAARIYLKYRDYLELNHQMAPSPEVTALYYEIRVPTLQNPIRPTDRAGESPAAILQFKPLGGAVPLESPFYLSRPIDTDFQSALLRQDSIVLIKGPRQTGKSSLLARGLHEARKHGAAVVSTDFLTFAPETLRSLDAVCLHLATTLATELDLECSPQADWNALLSPGVNLERFLIKRIMPAISTPLVWGLDEVDRLFTQPYGNEFFSTLRSWHEKRSFDPTKPWRRISLAISCATEAHLFIKDLNRSPFNVGTRLELGDLTLEQVGELNRRYGHPLPDDAQVMRFFGMLGGHPYLTQRGLYELARDTAAGQTDLSTFAERILRQDGPFEDHLRRLTRLVGEEERLRQAVLQTLQGKPCDAESFFRLRSGGILSGEDRLHALPRCRLYGDYLRRYLGDT
jgi:DNA-binding SARP family transcriptional activator